MSYPGDVLPAALAPGAPADADPVDPVPLADTDAERLPGGIALIRGERAVFPPRFELVDESGARHTPESLRGRVVRLQIWATWCATCRAEFPDLQRLHERWTDEGLVILAVCRNSDRAAFEKAVRKSWISFAAVDANDAKDFPFPVGAFPTAVFLDRAGRVRAFWQGWRRPEAVDELVRRLVEEPAPPGDRS